MNSTPKLSAEKEIDPDGGIDPILGRRFVDTWKIAGEFLEAEKVQRLRAMTDDEAREIMHAILAFPLPLDMPPRECGLVEQQKWFQKLPPHC